MLWDGGYGKIVPLLRSQVVPHIAPTAPMVPSLRHCYHNACFRILFWMHVVEQIGESAQWTMLPFVVDNLVQPATMENPMSSEMLYSIIGGFMMLAQALAIPIWRYMAQTCGKFWTYFFFHVLLVCVTIAKVFVEKHSLIMVRHSPRTFPRQRAARDIALRVSASQTTHPLDRVGLVVATTWSIHTTWTIHEQDGPHHLGL